MNGTSQHHVVIIGGGFGGLNVARRLARSPGIDVTVIDRRNFHLFQPLLYQVATGGLSPGDITSPIRFLLRRHRRTRVRLADVTEIVLDDQRVHTDQGPVAYDTLVVATGVMHHYFGHPEWEAMAPGLKTIEDATEMRSRMLSAFEHAELVADSKHEREAWLTFVIVGAGPTGVELAGTLAELSNDTLRRDFRSINPAESQILLVEGSDQVLTSYPRSLAEKAERSLARLGVDLRLQTCVSGVDERGVTVIRDGRSEFIPARCVLWAAGVTASPLGRSLAHQCGAETDAEGRVVVQPDLTLPGHSNVYVIGDLALCRDESGEPLPGVAPVAIQEGIYVAGAINKNLAGQSRAPFRYRNKGNLATIGRRAAIADFGWLRFSGFPAWFLWLTVHLVYLCGFENRLLVFIKWAISYLTRNRGARLIAHSHPRPPGHAYHEDTTVSRQPSLDRLGR